MADLGGRTTWRAIAAQWCGVAPAWQPGERVACGIMVGMTAALHSVGNDEFKVALAAVVEDWEMIAWSITQILLYAAT